LRRLEQAHRSTMAHHVHRATGLGAWVLINENWYQMFRDPAPESKGDAS